MDKYLFDLITQAIGPGNFDELHTTDVINEVLIDVGEQTFLITTAESKSGHCERAANLKCQYVVCLPEGMGWLAEQVHNKGLRAISHEAFL